MNIIFIALIILSIIAEISYATRNRDKYGDDTYQIHRFGFGRYRYNSISVVFTEIYNAFILLSNWNLKRKQRLHALKSVEKYLKPYKNIWGNHTISNTNCIIQLSEKSKTITCLSLNFDTKGKKLTFVAKDFHTFDHNETFNMICENFHQQTSYTDIYNLMDGKAFVTQMCYDNEEKQEENNTIINLNQTQSHKVDTLEIDISKNNNEVLIDINSATESELCSLPGIRIVTAKKIIAFREQQRLFNSIDDFLQTMKIKENYHKKIRSMACANNSTRKKKLIKKEGRILDI